MGTRPSARIEEGSGGRQRRVEALYVLAAFASGASMMIVEITGNRLLAPVFGSSTFSWTALIGVVLVAATAGGYLGGALADRPEAGRSMERMLYLTAFATLIIPPVAVGATLWLRGYGLIVGPTLFSIALFLVPGVAMGAVTPLATRLLSRAREDRQVGWAAGTANASGTLGSCIGTFAAGFVLIPLMSVRMIFVATALVLMAIAAAVTVAHGRVSRRRAMGVGVTASAGAVMLVVVELPLAQTVRLHTVTPYHSIWVVDEAVDVPDGQPRKTVRSMVHDRAVQGTLIVETGELPMRYTRHWRLAETRLDEIGRALVIGGGSFGIPIAIAERHPEALVRAYELDPKVIEVGRQWFGLDEHPEIEAVAGDARVLLTREDTRYDLIYADAYHGRRYIPPHLATREFFELVESRLEHDGLLMMNVIGALEGPGAAVPSAILSTMRSVFDDVEVYVANGIGERRVTNLTFVAGNGLLEPRATSAEARSYLEDRVPRGAEPKGAGIVLTDDRNPIDRLVAIGLREASDAAPGRW